MGLDSLPMQTQEWPATLVLAGHQHGIDVEAALARLGGRADVWARSVRALVRQLAGMGDEFRALLARDERGDAQRLLHTLKGLAGLLGAPALAGMAAQAEAALQAPLAAAALQALASRMGEAIGRSREDFELLLRLFNAHTATTAPPPAAPDPAALRQQLQMLAPLLADADMAATDLYADLISDHEALWAEALRPLGEAISALDFEAALVACHHLLQQLDS
jgi:HPt (histidine-containing phosphotransfer) domain-containing protein